MSASPDERAAAIAAIHACTLSRAQARAVGVTDAMIAHHRVRGAVVHQIGELAAHHVGLVGGLPTTVPARSIVDLAAIVGPKRLGDVVDIVTDRLTSVGHISACMGDVARPGKPGMARLGAVLDDRGPGYVPPQSELESVMFRALAAARLPAPRRQFPLPGRGAVEGMVDAAYIDERVIIEADGRRWHARIRQLRRDHERDAEAARAGWQTLRLLYEQLTESPAEQAAVVADVLAADRVNSAARLADRSSTASNPLPSSGQRAQVEAMTLVGRSYCLGFGGGSARTGRSPGATSRGRPR
jgi:very-short-patch-repair endonuclease